MSDTPPNSRAVAAITARVIMFVLFIGSAVTLVLFLIQSSLAVPVCIGFGVIALALLLIGGYYVGRARSG